MALLSLKRMHFSIIGYIFHHHFRSSSSSFFLQLLAILLLLYCCMQCKKKRKWRKKRLKIKSCIERCLIKILTKHCTWMHHKSVENYVFYYEPTYFEKKNSLKSPWGLSICWTLFPSFVFVYFFNKKYASAFSYGL